MENDEEASFFNFSDDLGNEAKKKPEKKEPTLEELICRKQSPYLYNCVSSRRAGPSKIEQYLAYDWDHPSEAAKKALTDQLDINNPFHPLEAIAVHRDPSGGKLLKLCLDNAKIPLKDFVCQQNSCSLLALSGPRGYLFETEIFLQHGTDPLELNGATLDSIIRSAQMDMLKLFKKYATDQALFFRTAMGSAARLSFRVLKYLIEEEKQSIEGRFPDKTILQLLLLNGAYAQHIGAAEISYILPLVRDINETDKDGNAVIFYVLSSYSVRNSAIADVILTRNPSMDVVARNFMGYKGEENILFFAVRVSNSEAKWKILDERTTLDNWKWKNEQGETLLHCICRVPAENLQFRKVFAMLKEKNLLRDMMLQKDNNNNTPIHAALSALHNIEMSRGENNEYISYDTIRLLRSIIRILIAAAIELDIDLTKLRSSDNKSLDSLLAWHDLLPKERRISPRIFDEEVAYASLGELTVLPRDVLAHIFHFFALSEAVALLTVSKKFFQILTCKQVWASELGADRAISAKETIEPFAALCATARVKKYMAYPQSSRFFSENIEVTNGEGNLSFEAGFIYGLKLHGKPIIASFPDNAGSITRCVVRSGTLTEEKKQYVAKLEKLLNGGLDAINLSMLVEDVKPFMNVLNNGLYSVALCYQQEFIIYEYYSTGILPHFLADYPSKQLLFFTQPSDLLDRTQIDFYKDEISRGKRPIILLLYCDWECYLIDGHHKMKAYMELGTISSAIFLSIEIVSLNKPLSRAEEMEYLGGIREAINAHKSAQRWHSYGDETK